MVCDRLIVTFYFGLLFALLPPKNQNSAQQIDGQTDGQMDGWKKWHIEMSATTKNFVKAAAVQLPYVSAEMTLPEFRKCWMDWNDINIFKKFRDSKLMLNYIAVVMQTSKTVLLALYLFFFFYSLKMSYLMQLKELLPNKVILVLIASHSAPLFSHHMKQLLLSWSL